MQRRALLAALAAGVAAGCTELVPEPTATPTRSPTASPTSAPTPTERPTPTAAPTPTETATPTESPTPSPTEEPTPTPTPTEFDRAVEDARRAIDDLVTAYVEQVPGAESILDVDASAVDFTVRDVNAAAGDAGNAIVDARELADAPEQRALLTRLTGVRAFLVHAARGQEALGNGYAFAGQVTDHLDEERLQTARDRLGSLDDTVPPMDRAVTGIRNNSSIEQLTAYGRLSEEEYTGKVGQLEGGVADVEAFTPVTETVIAGIERLRQARNLSGNDAEDRAASAIIRFDDALDAIDEELAGDVTAPFVTRYEELRGVVETKRVEAEEIAND